MSFDLGTEVEGGFGLGEIDSSQDLVTTSVFLYLAGMIAFFLLQDQIYPAQVTGKDSDGNNITLTVCPEAQPFEELYADKVNTPIEPALDQCVTYISARGFDRVQVLFEWTLLALVRDDEPEFCGFSGTAEYCYKLCTVNDKYIKRTFGSIACLVYDNGRPDMPNVSLVDIMNEKLQYPIEDADVTDDFMCMKANVDYNRGGSASNSYCTEPCGDQIVPVQSNPSPNFCYRIYQSSFFEKITSLVAFLPNYIQEMSSNFSEYTFCSPNQLSGETEECPTVLPFSETSLKGCRPDGKGVWAVTPGTTSCLIFFNGHDWPVGASFLIAATSVAGTSFLGGSVGLVGMMGFGSMTGAVDCPSTTSCRVNNKCCPYQFSVNGPVCPSIC